MRILALETSGASGSVAALDDGRVLVERPLAPDQRSAQALAPAMHALMAELRWKPCDVGLVAVTRGPGSFTGLRIGITTAKLFAYAVGAEVIGVDTLEVVARQAPAGSGVVHAVIDAQREQLFTAAFARDSAGRLAELTPTQVIDAQAWLAALHAGDVASGPGLKRLADRLPAGVVVVERSLWAPTASMVGQIGFEQFAAGRRDDKFQLVPHYFRRTAAEEQWERKHTSLG